MAADLHSLARIMWDEGRHLEAVPFQEQAIRIKSMRGDEDLEEFIEDLEALKANEPFPYSSA